MTTRHVSHPAAFIAQAAINYASRRNAVIDRDMLLPTRMVPVDESVFVEITDFTSSQSVWIVVVETPRGDWSCRHAVTDEVTMVTESERRR